jgi:formate dehydrogenase subunit delta
MSHEPGHTSGTDRLVMMANQISRAFAHSGEAKAVAATLDHLRKFWEPRMRAAIIAHVEKGGAGLDPYALKAVQRLAQSS